MKHNGRNAGTPSSSSFEADLRAYLNHPAHVTLGQRFFQTAEAALVYDFVMVEPDRVRDLLD